MVAPLGGVLSGQVRVPAGRWHLRRILVRFTVLRKPAAARKQRGLLPPRGLRGLGYAVQADCLAGATLFGAAADGELVFESGDQKELAAALSALADETSWTGSKDHGDPFERIGSFDQGRLYGLTACIPDLRTAYFGELLNYKQGISVSVSTSGYRELTPVSPSTTPGRAVIFKIVVSNNGPSAFDAGHMSKPIVRYGDKGIAGELVPDPEAVLGPVNLPILQPGETGRVLVGAVVPENTGSSVRVVVLGPDPETDFSATFQGNLPL